MSCPVCDGTMANVYVEPRPGVGQMAIFHCDRCGALKQMFREMPNETTVLEPNLIGRLVRFRQELTEDQRDVWHALGIDECILKPDERTWPNSVAKPVGQANG